jgi:hypothetical protein
MQSENFDKKLRDLLSQRPPGNDDPRWDTFERLLDRHMPREKKDNRRMLIVLFLFLLLGGGAFIIWKNNTGNEQNISSTISPDKNPEHKSTGNKTPSGNSSPDASTITEKEKVADQLPTGNDVDPGSLQQEAVTSDKKYADPNDGPSPEFIIADATVSKTKKIKPLAEQVKTENNVVENGVVNKEKEADPLKEAEKIKSNTPITQKLSEPVKEKESQNIIAENKPVEKITVTKNEPAASADQPSGKKPVKSNSFANNFFFTISAGPDFSMVGLDNAGKTKLTLGAGIGYQVSEKFSIRTGFYSSRKVYAADPEDYNPPEAFWSWYPNLKNIDANCKIYEIPITVDYTFSRNKKQSWFASAGVSSLIMKEETYDYYYKPNYSPTYVTYTKTFNNENKHLFSVLNLSGGYRRNINKNLSLQAEPYMKFAMSGVGFGKVKLNSGGVLISAVIKPFAKK